MESSELRKILNDVKENTATLLKGAKSTLKKSVLTFFSGGHLLLEDVPGTGKTTLAKALAKSLDMDFSRIQFTPDLMPADVTGVSIYNQNTAKFEFRNGPIFSNIILADEINRASPRTQSALLEAMGEGQVSTDSGQFILKKPFFVIATQNNVESKGTYTLPESQMDRFTMKLSLGYVSIADEIKILEGNGFLEALENLKPVVNAEKVVEAMKEIEKIEVSGELKQFIVEVVNATRRAEGVKVGASPRASLNLMKVAQVSAAMEGRKYIVPDDILDNVVDVLAHRLILDSSAYVTGVSGENAVLNVLEKIKVPT